MNVPVIIFGTGNMARMALDIIQSQGREVYGFLKTEQEEEGKNEIDGIPVLGKANDEGFTKLIPRKAEGLIALEDPRDRLKWSEYLRDVRKSMPLNAFHEGSNISKSSFFGYGNMVAPGALINAGAEMKNFVLINSGSILDLGAFVSDHVEIGAGSIIGAHARVDEGAIIGNGSLIAPGIKVGKKAMVGIGSVVVQDVKDGEQVFGNPAKSYGS